jgi:hypothetical protein
MLDTFHKYNKLEIYRHVLFTTAYLYNNLNPEGIRVGLGLYNTVISMLYYNDFVMSTGAVRGNYNEQLIKDTDVPDEYIGENPNLKPYHYQGNPDD